MKISVIICTHNPREDYLRRVLAALKAQTLPLDQWELLLVDNASREPLAGVWDISWHPHARHLHEEKTGLTHARLCGIAAAQGELLVFVDDDNVLRPDYLQAALKISTDYPWLGAWSGRCLPEFEIEPPSELRPWLDGLVIEKLETPVWARLPILTFACPVGAGMVVRQKQANHYRGQVQNDPLRQTLDRCGTNLGGGGDSDMALSGFDLGYGTGKFPDLELTHLIPARRLTLEYMAGINEGFGHSQVILERIYNQPSQPLFKNTRLRIIRLILLNLYWLVTAKSRGERRIRNAKEQGRLRAYQELQKLRQS